MATPVKLKRSGTATATPSSLEYGEIAINYADGVVFYRDGSDVIQSFALAAYAPISSPTFDGITQADAYAFEGDGDTGMGHPAADQVGLFAAGLLRLHCGLLSRTYVIGNSEPYGLGVRWSGTGGPVYFGPTDGTSTPSSAIFNAGGAEIIRFANNGNVTIGEANNANSRLMVAGGSSNISSARATYEGTVQINESGLTTLEATGGVEFKGSVFGSGYGTKLCGYDDGSLAIGNRANSATWTERLRINQNGELLIGTTTDNGAYLLQVNSQIYATNATIATSDARFKTNVESLTDATAVVESLRPVVFDFIPHDDRNFAAERQVGLIAQEAREALAGTDYADSIVAQCGDHLGLAYEKLVPVLIRALQESNARIAALEERLDHA